ncbi:isoprenyl transferase [Siculibacillus lacustris]|uniref:Isoprenyl transferase n=1 Tax=Siculibacillus lacustris TaxID=1549641 RepID=A0A4Q9VS82_9HYPH|nr:isoprenyl transferase [Siculibacillus lacustris]TBW38483.1 isoprenyl transferase [Siculibacillus lacustris]
MTKATEDPAGHVSDEGPGEIPRHVAVIMDGNGRWAQARGLPRTEGHRRGMESLRRIIRHASGIGVGYLTLYSFSSENWRRPAEEVGFLMSLLRFFIRRDLAELHAERVRIRVIGLREGLAPDIAALLDEAESLTAGNDGLTLVIAFNYGSRAEIAEAVRALAVEVAAGRLDPAAIDSDAIGERLFTAGLPDPDLVIRTSGEQRLSNFLLWQSAYSELVFSPVHWPDFDEARFDEAIREYNARERRFGGVGARQGVR